MAQHRERDLPEFDVPQVLRSEGKQPSGQAIGPVRLVLGHPPFSNELTNGAVRLGNLEPDCPGQLGHPKSRRVLREGIEHFKANRCMGPSVRARRVHPSSSSHPTSGRRGAYLAVCTQFNGFHYASGMVKAFTVGEINQKGKWVK